MTSSKRLYLLRHAKSSWDAAGLDDFDRPLNQRGRQAASAMGEQMKRRGLLPDLVLCSPAARAEETWIRVAAELPEKPPFRLLRSLYLAPPSRLLDRVRAVEESVSALLLVAHNPGLEHLAARLAGPGSTATALEMLSGKFPTGALACFELEGVWATLAPEGARLTVFLRPRDLE